MSLPDYDEAMERLSLVQRTRGYVVDNRKHSLSLERTASGVSGAVGVNWGK